MTVSQPIGDIFKLFSHALKWLLGAAARPDAGWVSSPTCIELGPGDCISLVGRNTYTWVSSEADVLASQNYHLGGAVCQPVTSHWQAEKK